MKVLLINGSPRSDGNTARALAEMCRVFEKNGIETRLFWIGTKDIRGCVGCGNCASLGKCVFDDIVNEISAELRDADGLVVGSPVYYASPNGTVLSLMDRLFFSAHYSMAMKVGAAVAVARRAGTTATFDVLNKYFTISGMPVASSTYWNSAFGGSPGEAEQDVEGMQTMVNLAENMTFLMKSIALGKKEYGLPKNDKRFMNFIRPEENVKAVKAVKAVKSAPAQALNKVLHRGKKTEAEEQS
ncbi:MAG: flavodoxin family protein [Lachnospiraceae bacterium]|nr:flavodoxin family protein [Lachnospiraceae bacterium]